MSVNINGNTGASLVQDTTITQGKLASNVVGNGPCFSAYQSVAQSFPNATLTKIQFQTKDFDVTNAFDNTTNYRFQPTVAGYYQVNASFSLTITAGTLFVSLSKNGSEYARGVQCSGAFQESVVSSIVFLNGTTDYLEALGNQTSGSTQNSTTADSVRLTAFSAALIRAA